LQEISPQQFERLILDPLSAMGYGGGDIANGRMTKATGDGGIDGIINEDALGLDAVYIQAKRNAADNKVSRPDIQRFVGSLTGEGATKGVFVTTSDFSREARDYLTRVQHRIVLINGQMLARLMIQHGVGVRARSTYVVRSVDEDYFSGLNSAQADI
jgi:restriction system protein